MTSPGREPRHALLTQYGLTEEIVERHANESRRQGQLGRLVRVERGMDAVVVADEEIRPSRAHPLHRQADLGVLPATGDWVVVETDEHGPAIVEVLARATVVTRRDPQERDLEQVVVANVDTAMVVHGLDRPLNTRRLERMLVVIYDGGAQPVLVLTKSDLFERVEPVIETVRAVSSDVEIVVVSNETGHGFDGLERFRRPSETVALLGEGGAGKSSLVNRWCGADQEVGEVRTGDAKGRHTTVVRELLPMGDGAVIIDTPGVRGLGLWNAEDGLDLAFPDIERLADDCRFNDCKHAKEPDCAVLDAVASGDIETSRHRSYLDLADELANLRRRQVAQERAQRRGRRRRR